MVNRTISSHSMAAFERHIEHINHTIAAQKLDTKKDIESKDLKPGTLLVAPGWMNIHLTQNSESSHISPLGHAVIICDSEHVIEATGNWSSSSDKADGVIQSTILDFKKKYNKFYVIWANCAKPEDGNNALEYAKSQLGKNYNKDFFNRDTEECFYCSQLCWRAWKEAGFAMDYDYYGPLDTSKTWVAPNDLTAGHFDSQPLYKVKWKQKKTAGGDSLE